MDAALLEEISLWREALARSIALGNPALSQRDLNFSVQRTIDRLLFLRICEDRAIEEYGRFKVVGVYARLLKLFAEADERYNSGIFHFQTSPTPSMSPATTAWWSWWLSVLTLNKLPSAGTDHDRGQLARSRPPTGRSTWAWLYDLTEEEIDIMA